MDLKQRQFKNMQSGMTLVELVVVLVIVSVVSAVLIFNSSSFRNRITLRTLSQEIALSVRKAQSYATSVRSIEGVTADTSDFPAYGISFSVASSSSPDGATPSARQFILFADIVNDSGERDGKYNNGGSCGAPTEGNECLESFTINSADRITQLCAEGNCSGIENIDIVFMRPAPDAIACVISAGSCDSDRPSDVEIVINSVAGESRTVSVWNTGQISVE